MTIGHLRTSVLSAAGRLAGTCNIGQRCRPFMVPHDGGGWNFSPSPAPIDFRGKLPSRDVMLPVSELADLLSDTTGQVDLDLGP